MWCLCLLWLKYKFSRPRWLNYWNSGKSRYMPYPVSIFASQHKNSSDGLFSIVRQNSACSDLSSQVILKVAWNKKSVGSGGGGREQVDSGKADLATHFPSVCENVKPKMHSIGENGNHRGAMQARLPAFPHTYPTAKTHLPLGEVERWNQVRKDTELGQNDFRRGSEWPGFQQTTGLGHGEPLKDTLVSLQRLMSSSPGSDSSVRWGPVTVDQVRASVFWCPTKKGRVVLSNLHGRRLGGPWELCPGSWPTLSPPARDQEHPCKLWAFWP